MLSTGTHGLAADSLASFVYGHPRLMVLTGAGISTESGIPDYRDADGAWKVLPPVELPAFMAHLAVRQRYWARSLVGWPHFSRARPNDAHHALTRLEDEGRVELLVTQNVDGLHTAAGSRNVVDLHGRLDVVRCMACAHRLSRAELQHELVARNPGWEGRAARIGPDGDVDLQTPDFTAFAVPVCPVCEGILKPDVVFFGEAVPRQRVDLAFAAVARADALLIVGSSLMVYSGYRFAAAAAAAGKPIAAVNLGRTRADHLLTLKVQASCAEALLAVFHGNPGQGRNSTDQATST